MKLPVNYSKTPFWERAYVRDEYVKLQEGLCYYCGSPLNTEAPQHIEVLEINWRLFPKNFLKYPVHLHHCHDTDLTIGAVHNICNAVLWQYHGE